MTYELKTSDSANYSASRCLQFIDTIITGRKNAPMQGEQVMSDGSIVRFKNGLIDGGELPAIETADGNVEYWHKGHPDGQPAILSDFGTREEDWANGKLIAIRSDFEIKPVTEK